MKIRNIACAWEKINKISLTCFIEDGVNNDIYANQKKIWVSDKSDLKDFYEKFGDYTLIDKNIVGQEMVIFASRQCWLENSLGVRAYLAVDTLKDFCEHGLEETIDEIFDPKEQAQENE